MSKDSIDVLYVIGAAIGIGLGIVIGGLSLLVGVGFRAGR